MNPSNNKSDNKASDSKVKNTAAPTTNFVRARVEEDLRTSKYGGRVMTRFPPEPNGYLHIGHAKSICLNFGIAKDYGGICNLRFDDTNPSTEEVEYVESILNDIRWLGYDWEDREYYASDYFEELYGFALKLIKDGHAYVCDLSADEIKEYRGSLTEPGRDSPYRNRTVEENLDLFTRMRSGEFSDGSRVLRAKIDMRSPNINMRDPTIYRIKHESHHRTGDKWCVYPMYDFAHGNSDAVEGVTHSICTLEFENHRPLYDWFIEMIGLDHHPQQIEFARLNISYTVLSKRRLLQLVSEGHVNGWDDPRMPTITGMRRRGITAASIRDFCDRIGVSKRETVIDVSILENSIREDLNENSPRVMGVLDPLRIVIENYPEEKVEEFEAPYHPTKPEMGKRTIPFSHVLYIEREDFMEDPPKKFFRLAPDREVRLRYGYFIRCVDVVKDESTGKVVELRCTYDPETRGGHAPDGRKVKATLHWVSADKALKVEARLYDRLFLKENPMAVEEGKTWKDYLNPDSLKVVEAYVEPSLATAKSGDRVQFERKGYFCVDKDSSDKKLVFNRTIALRDTWAKIQSKAKKTQK